MHRVLVLYLPPKDPQAFREHYETTHLPLASAMPGQRSFRYSFDVGTAEGTSPYFAVGEAEFDDIEAVGAALGSPEGQALQADMQTLATGGVVVLNYPIQEP